MKKEFSFLGKSDHIILSEFLKFGEHFVVIIASVHNKSSFFKKLCPCFNGGKSDGIRRFVTLFRGGMNPGKDADRMSAVCHDASLRNMIAFFINIFNRGTFRAITNSPQSLKFVTIGFDNIGIIDVNNGFRRSPVFNKTAVIVP